MGNENQNKLFTLTVEIEIGMNFIVSNLFTLSWNWNRFLQVTKLTLIDDDNNNNNNNQG